jgi:hypothetical protein
VTPDEMRAHAAAVRAKKIFDKVDKNGDGILDAAELTAARRLGRRLLQADADGDGTVTLAEYQAYLAAQRAKAQAARQLLQTFKTADANNDRKLSVAEWPANATATHAQVDANSDGQVTPREIAAYMKANNGAVPF